ncbi:hypothetical protein EXU48_00020 [Occultella glacieicola]|uniref:Flagellar protein FlbD n=1 Tax=Occultella glacieicola TaxID=2518684 RepID=A0ABY2E812_9MICO|nr:flagellar FlbD family protein [Occultella glacieicola]TDE98645.1 hypothetical protein EXU48_00020 [Occultella glacieicola]
MILLTRLNGARFAINPDLVERMHATPDTTLILVDGSKHVVAEPLDVVLDRIIDFRAAVVSRARDLPLTSDRTQLGLVPLPSAAADPTAPVPLRSRKKEDPTWTPQR